MSTIALQRASSPTARTRSLYDYMDELYDKIARRAFATFEREGYLHGHDLEHWLEAESEFLSPVPVEVSETETEFAIRAQVPGFSEKELEIIAEPGRLFIMGKSEKKIEERKRKTVYSEIFGNEVFRTFTLPADIDPEKVSAVLKNGVLEIFLQKAKPAKKVVVMAKAA